MDIQILLWLQAFRNATNGIFNSFFVFLSGMGWSVMPFLIMSLIYWCLDKQTGQYLLMSDAFARPLNSLIKLTACIYRPWVRDPAVQPLTEGAGTATGYAFPSGHVATATAVYGGVAAEHWRNRALRWSMIILIVLIGISRNYIGVHTPQDVLVSMAASSAVLWAGRKILRWLDSDRKHDLIFLGICLALIIGLMLYFNLKPYPLDYDETGKLLVDPAKMKLDSFGDLGALFGFAIGWVLERRSVGFTTAGLTPARGAARYTAGAIIVLFLFSCSASIFALFLPTAAAKFLDSTLVMLFIGWLYPLIFTKLEAGTAVPDDPSPSSYQPIGRNQ